MKNEAWWQPKNFSKKITNLEKRQKIVDGIRSFFKAQDFFAVETPALQVSPGLEVHIMPFKTEELYLHTSPEFTMKKLLVAGLPKIFQITKVYRHEKRSSTHHPEFTMLEWYRAHADYRNIMKDCEALLCHVLKACGENSFSWQGKISSPFAPWEYISVHEAFQKYAEVILSDDYEALSQSAKKLGIATDSNDSWEDIFFRIFLEKIEPKLGSPTPTILYDYPIYMAALARPKPGNPKLAERFEIYVCGLELANAFSELTDANVQKLRFTNDIEKKYKLYGKNVPIDDDFIAALQFGMPESAGIALGVDRLVMLCTGADHIEAVLWAPVAELGD